MKAITFTKTKTTTFVRKFGILSVGSISISHNPGMVNVVIERRFSGNGKKIFIKGIDSSLAMELFGML